MNGTVGIPKCHEWHESLNLECQYGTLLCKILRQLIRSDMPVSGLHAPIDSVDSIDSSRKYFPINFFENYSESLHLIPNEAELDIFMEVEVL